MRSPGEGKFTKGNQPYRTGNAEARFTYYVTAGDEVNKVAVAIDIPFHVISQFSQAAGTYRHSFYLAKGNIIWAYHISSPLSD